MAINAADLTEGEADSGTATFERKRPHDVLSRDDASNAGSAHSTPRKRAKYAGKLGHQDIRDFVPVGASFSTSAAPVDEVEDRGNDASQAETSLKAESLSDYEILKASEFKVAEKEKALIEGRRLVLRDLPPDVTEEDLKHFFKGYSIENIWLPDPMGVNSQLVTIAQEENLSLNGDSALINRSDGAATTITNDGRRLYVGNLPYGVMVEDLREFFRGFSLENVTIPINPRTRRSVGYAFVTVSSSEEADRATSQLSGHEIQDRKVSVQRARAEDMKAPDPGASAAVEGASNARSKRMEGYHGMRGANFEDKIEEDNVLRAIPETISPQDVQAAPPMNWNAVNTTKIRTTLGGSVGKAKDLVDESSLANEGHKEPEGLSNQDLATSVALERVEGLRDRLSGMDPLDGPVSAYKSAQQELHEAEVDYNYCLYFPVDEVFQPPPLSTAHKFTPKRKNGREHRLRIWGVVEQCMKEGTLQDLKEGKLRMSTAERLGQPSPGQKSAFESSDGLEQTYGQTTLQTSTVTDPKQIQILDTQETSRKQYGYLKAFPNMKPGTHSYEKMKKRIHETKIHLNYSQYFPATEDYLPLALAKKGVNEMNSSNIEGVRGSERRAAQIWKLVEQCTQDGNLQDLKDGRLAAWLKDAPPPNQSFFASALQVRRSPKPAGMTGHNKPQYSGGRKDTGKSDFGTASASVKPTLMQQDESRERQDTSESGGGVILNLDYGNQDSPSKIQDEDVQIVMNSGNRGEETSDVNGQDVKQKLPATNQVDHDLYASDSDAASDSDTESSDSKIDSEGKSEDDDAMMQYSNSEQIAVDEAERNTGIIAIPPSHKAPILASLSSHDLNTQLRYFYTTKAREEVDGNTPVRCLVCMKEGHMAGFCEFLNCSTCGAFNQHLTRACPNNAKCAKCREEGHDEGYCPYKLKRMPQHEIVCDLCQRNGHVEEDCELTWRTSGPPWESDLANANIRFSCYECGRSGHLGNDCRSRKPNKSMGTSTWDGNMGQVSIKSTREIKIKGKATQQDPINIDDSDDEQANFFRPKISVPEPVRRGQIRILTGRSESPVYETTRNDGQAYGDHRHDSFTPVNESYRNDEARQQYPQYRDEGRVNWRANDGPSYATGTDHLRYNSNYRSSDRRSRSPQYRDRGSYASGNSRPPLRPAPRAEHQDRRPPVDANIYLPMPSAAQNAWTKRRIQVRERKQSAGTSFPNSCPLRISIEHLLTFALQASTSLAPTATAHLYKFQGSGKYFSICQNISVPFLTALIDPTDCYALFCDYCDVYLTHDSMSVRKAHNSGRNHERNVLDYYQQIGHEKAQSVIDSITSSYAAEGQAGANPMLAPQGGPPMGGQGFPPPPFGFPAGMPPPPFMPGPGGPPPGFIPPPGGRGMPPFPPFPPAASPDGNGPPMPGMPGGMPFPPPGGLPPNFQGFPPPMGGPGQGMSPAQGGFPPPQGMPPFQGGR